MSTRMTITIDDKLYRELGIAAGENERSISQEIAFRLKKVGVGSAIQPQVKLRNPITASEFEAISSGGINEVKAGDDIGTDKVFAGDGDTYLS